MNIKSFVPPFIFTIKNKLFPEVETEYLSFEEAQLKCVNGGYNNVEVCNVVADKTMALKNNPGNINSQIAILFAGINHIRAEGKDTLTVLDFGGACGAHYIQLRKILPETVRLKWIVIETQQMVQVAKIKLLQSDELMWV